MTNDLDLGENAEFARIMAVAFNCELSYDDHNVNFVSIRIHLTEHRSIPESEVVIVECEASGHVWSFTWYANSVGSFQWIAGTYPGLVRKVLASAAVNSELADGVR